MLIVDVVERHAAAQASTMRKRRHAGMSAANVKISKLEFHNKRTWKFLFMFWSYFGDKRISYAVLCLCCRRHDVQFLWLLLRGVGLSRGSYFRWLHTSWHVGRAEPGKSRDKSRGKSRGKIQYTSSCYWVQLQRSQEIFQLFFAASVNSKHPMPGAVAQGRVHLT